MRVRISVQSSHRKENKLWWNKQVTEWSKVTKRANRLNRGKNGGRWTNELQRGRCETKGIMKLLWNRQVQRKTKKHFVKKSQRAKIQVL